MLKDMVRSRRSDARTRELKHEVAARRKGIRTDAPLRAAAPIEVSPSSSGATPARRTLGPATNTMQRLD